MRYLARKDRRRRLLFSKKEKLVALLHSVSRVQELGVERGYTYSANLLALARVYFTQLQTRCRYTGSARSVWRILHISRTVFKACAHFGWFFGIKRLAW